MTMLEVVSASYAPDVDLFGDLHRSVLEFTPADTVHQVVVPRRDRRLFERFAGPRCRISTPWDLLPRTFVDLPGVNGWINLRRPAPLVRGWIMQQLLKIAATARSAADVVLLADSDVALVRPTTADDLLVDGKPRFYRWDDAVTPALPLHVEWHGVARQLLGLSAAAPPLPDYISAFSVWTPPVARALQARIGEVTGRHWSTAAAGMWKFSEFILYGVFVDEVLRDPASVAARDTMRCHSYWETDPLDEAAARAFVESMAGDDLAVMISAKSHTPLPVRRDALAHARRIAAAT